MFWRVLLVICSLTFLNAGCQVLGDEDCKSVDIGGNRRAMSYECHRYADTGEFSQGAAGGLGIAIGLGMILLAGWPWISATVRNQNRNAYPRYSTRPNPPSSEALPPPRAPSRPAMCLNPDCRRQLETKARFCGYCGTKVP